MKNKISIFGCIWIVAVTISCVLLPYPANLIPLATGILILCWSDFFTWLKWFPFLSHFVDWKQFDGFDWANMLAQYPHLNPYCDFSKFDHADWVFLAACRPQFKNHPIYKLMQL